MKQKKRWLTPVVLALALVAGYAWYTRPLTLNRLCPTFAWADTTHMGGYEELVGIRPEHILSANSLPIDDPQAQDIYRRLLTAEFRRDPFNTLLIWSRGYYAYTAEEAGGVPVLAFFAPNQRTDVQLTEDGEAHLHSAHFSLHLRNMDEALLLDALAFLRDNRWDGTVQAEV